MIESLQSVRLEEHNIIEEMKCQFFIGILHLCFLPLHSSGIPSNFLMLFT